MRERTERTDSRNEATKGNEGHSCLPAARSAARRMPPPFVSVASFLESVASGHLRYLQRERRRLRLPSARRLDRADRRAPRRVAAARVESRDRLDRSRPDSRSASDTCVRATCSSPTTRAFSRRGCSDTACRAAARSSACCSREKGRATPHDQIWSALVHPGQKLKPGARSAIRAGVERRDSRAAVLRPAAGPVVGRTGTARSTRGWTRSGTCPLPPYIHRPDAAADRERYQTIFARPRGSVAAPTAGLHFDAALLEGARRAGVRARDAHAARRLRHVQAGARRQHRGARRGPRGLCHSG